MRMAYQRRAAPDIRCYNYWIIDHIRRREQQDKRSYAEDSVYGPGHHPENKDRAEETEPSEIERGIVIIENGEPVEEVEDLPPGVIDGVVVDMPKSTPKSR
jgi:hypothetical protein